MQISLADELAKIRIAEAKTQRAAATAEKPSACLTAVGHFDGFQSANPFDYYVYSAARLLSLSSPVPAPPRPRHAAGTPTPPALPRPRHAAGTPGMRRACLAHSLTRSRGPGRRAAWWRWTC